MRRTSLGAVGGVLLVMASAAHAQTLDQSLEAPGGLYHTINTGFDWAQTFTAGLSGRLTRVDVQAVKEATTTTLPLTVELRRTVAGAPVESNSDVLASVSLPASQFLTLQQAGPPNPQWVTADFGAGVPINSGDVLAIVLRSDEPLNPFVRGYLWRSYPQGEDEYAGGDAFRRFAGEQFQRQTGIFSTDSGFRTYVTVPEPGAAATVLAAACGALLARRRQRLPVLSAPTAAR